MDAEQAVRSGHIVKPALTIALGRSLWISARDGSRDPLHDNFPLAEIARKKLKASGPARSAMNCSQRAFVRRTAPYWELDARLRALLSGKTLDRINVRQQMSLGLGGGLRRCTMLSCELPQNA
jgi:hypothetical protein